VGRFYWWQSAAAASAIDDRVVTKQKSVLKENQMARRNFAVDFQRDVGARTNNTTGRTWQAIANADGTHSVQLNGVTKFKVFWNGSGHMVAPTDSNPSGDSVIVFDTASGTQSVADVNQFLLNLN
jgi:hypothetical protein